MQTEEADSPQNSHQIRWVDCAPHTKQQNQPHQPRWGTRGGPRRAPALGGEAVAAVGGGRALVQHGEGLAQFPGDALKDLHHEAAARLQHAGQAAAAHRRGQQAGRGGGKRVEVGREGGELHRRAGRKLRYYKTPQNSNTKKQQQTKTKCSYIKPNKNKMLNKNRTKYCKTKFGEQT